MWKYEKIEMETKVEKKIYSDSFLSENGIYSLLEKKNLKKLKRKFPNCEPTQKLKDYLETFVKDGDVELIKLLLKKVSFSEKYLAKVCQDSLDYENKNVTKCFLRFCYEYFPSALSGPWCTIDMRKMCKLYVLYNEEGYNLSDIAGMLLDYAAENGDLEFIKYLHKEDFVDYNYKIINECDVDIWCDTLDTAIRNMRREVILYIAKKIHKDPESIFFTIKSVILDNKNVLDIIKLLFSLKDEPNLSDYFLDEYGDDLVYCASIKNNLELLCFFFRNGMSMEYISPEQEKYFSRMRKFYSRWRLIHWKNWFRKVVTPLYYSPKCQGGEKELEKISIRRD